MFLITQQAVHAKYTTTTRQILVLFNPHALHQELITPIRVKMEGLGSGSFLGRVGLGWVDSQMRISLCFPKTYK